MLNNLTISEASKLIQKKELSPVKLLQSVWERIESIEPTVQAWVTLLKRQSMEEAIYAEKEILEGRIRGPLHGIPYGAKDSYYTSGIRTSAGSKALANFIPNYDATVISHLKKSGAILLGKTTMTEYAFGTPPFTRNPWNLEHTPGASSTGSAAALASSMALFTLGTQTAGSLSRPASFNGVTTLKPTYGLISRTGIIPASWSLDHPGAFTRTVEDTAIVMQAIAGFDQMDSTSLNTSIPNYRDSLVNDIKNMTLGIPDSFFFDDIDVNVAKAFEESIRCYQELGAKVVKVSMPKNFLEANEAHTVVMETEAAAYHQDYYTRNPELYGEQLSKMLERGNKTTAIDYIRAMETRKVFRNELVTLLKEVDAIMTPANPSPAPWGLDYTGTPKFNAPFSNTGAPTLTIPMGFAQETNLPVGLQLASRPLGEERLIRIGYAFQSITNWHLQKPTFLEKSITKNI